jgi:hypothetical protein
MVRRQSTADVSTEEILRLRDEIRAESDATHRFPPR